MYQNFTNPLQFPREPWVAIGRLGVFVNELQILVIALWNTWLWLVSRGFQQSNIYKQCWEVTDYI